MATHSDKRKRIVFRAHNDLNAKLAEEAWNLEVSVNAVMTKILRAHFFPKETEEAQVPESATGTPTISAGDGWFRTPKGDLVHYDGVYNCFLPNGDAVHIDALEMVMLGATLTRPKPEEWVTI